MKIESRANSGQVDGGRGSGQFNKIITTHYNKAVVPQTFPPLTPSTIFADFCPSRNPAPQTPPSHKKKAYNNKSKNIFCAYSLYMTGTFTLFCMY